MSVLLTKFPENGIIKHMTKWLLRLFVRDYEKTDQPNVRVRYGMLSGAVGIVLNVLLCAAKFVAGIFTYSIAIVADALNNLSDAGSSVVTLVGFRMSGKPADHEHPYGHGRMEYMAGFIVSTVILVVGFELIKSSVEKILSPAAISVTLFSAIVMGVAIFVKLFLFGFNRSLARRIQSDAMKATARDSLSDAVATLAVLASIGVQYFWGVNIDGYVGVLVALFILWTGFGSAKEMFTLLLGKAPDASFVHEIEQTVLAHREVLGVHDVIVHDYGAGRSMISLHAEVPADGDILELHDCIDLIEMELRKRFDCEAVIHLDPIETDNETVDAIRTKVAEIVRGVSPGVTMHDFRMVNGKTHTNLIFDLVVPYQSGMSPAEAVQKVREGVRKIDENYFAVIHAERPYY